MPTLPRLRLPTAPQEWTRRKLQILLVIAATLAFALAAGGVWSVTATLHQTPTSSTSTPNNAPSGTSEDQLAAATLPPATLEQAQPGPLSTGRAGTLQLPPPSTVGAANVPSGFPHTVEGAMAQLIAIDQAAIQPGSVTTAQLVIEKWAAPGGPTPQTWSGVHAVTALLSSAGLPADGSGGLAISVSPAMGFAKGRIGDDFVVPCVDFVITAELGGQTHRVAAADCQRMVWRNDRWSIGPGAEPAQAPSLWPGTQDSFDAGYQWLAVSP